MLKRLNVLFLILPLLGYSQITFKINSLPQNTRPDDRIYLVGNINNWNPGDIDYQLTKDKTGQLSITIPEGLIDVEFKFTRGSWESTEGNPAGKYLNNRIHEFSGKPQTVMIDIHSWEDLAGAMNNTNSKNVTLLRPEFYMPQLNRFRKIWLYLPPDYATSQKKYPVIYMQDGQNLFDNMTSFSGEWGVDETLDELYKQKYNSAIIVGISNGSLSRNNEYSPWKNVTYGGGEGDAYLQFIVETLKPHIDSNYRTLSNPENTALIGSSLGALIATYGGCKYPEVFGKIGALSPAYWYSFNDFNRYIANLPETKLTQTKFYVVAGEKESNLMTSDIETVTQNLSKKGLKSNNTKVKIDPDGTHTETYWKREFALMYKWLFPAN